MRLLERAAVAAVCVFLFAGPVEKYTSSVRWEAWERDCMRYPQGKPDLRGEKLFRNLEILDDPSSLDIFFIGLLHIPLFHKELKEKGFKPYITCWHFQEEMNDWDPFQMGNSAIT